MLRCAQNILAVGFQRHLRSASRIDDLAIIDAFRDFENRAYSIHRVIARSAELFGMKAGEWFGPNRACLCLQRIHAEKQLPGTEDLVISSQATDVPIVLEMLLQDFCGPEARICHDMEHG